MRQILLSRVGGPHIYLRMGPPPCLKGTAFEVRNDAAHDVLSEEDCSPDDVFKFDYLENVV